MVTVNRAAWAWLGEVSWRSAVSRANYGAFHVARELLASGGFRPPEDQRLHASLWLRLSNAGHPDGVA